MNNQNAGGQNYPVNSAQQPGYPQQPVYPQQAYQQQGYPPQPFYGQPPYPAVPMPLPMPQPVPQPVQQNVQQVYAQPIIVVPRPAPQAVSPTMQKANEAVSSMKTGLFVLLSVIFGWICGRSLLSFHTGVGITVMGLTFFLFYIPFIVFGRDKKFSLFGWLLFIPQILILLSFTFFSDTGVVLIGLLASFIIAAVQTTLLSDSTSGKPFTFRLFMDTCANYFVYPFVNLGTTLAGVFGAKDKAKKNATARKIALGAAISIPVVFILIMLFAFADQMFATWVRNILTWLNINPFRVMADIFLTVIVMLYVMPLVVTLRSGYHKETSDKQARKVFDPIITSTVLFAASVIYLVFVAVQFTYLFAGIGRLPEGLTIAEYSRRGFFELVFVIVVTTIVIAVVCVLTKNNKNGVLPAYVKAALLLITASNGVIIVSAARRLLIYIGAFNLTASRFNAAVLIILMAVADIVIALRILFDHLRVSAVMGSVLALTAAFYCICNVDGFVSKYNVDQYLSNPKTYKIDVGYLAEELSVAAIPQLERLMNEAPDATVREKAKYGISYAAYRHDLFNGDERKLARWTFDRQRAVDIIEKNHITEDMESEYWDRFVYSYY